MRAVELGLVEVAGHAGAQVAEAELGAEEQRRIEAVLVAEELRTEAVLVVEELRIEAVLVVVELRIEAVSAAEQVLRTEVVSAAGEQVVWG